MIIDELSTLSVGVVIRTERIAGIFAKPIYTGQEMEHAR